MKCDWTIIPNIDEIEGFLELADRYGAAFEYNEFFEPKIYEDKDETRRMIEFYKSLDRDRSRDTLHGVFYDISAMSNDSYIRDYSRKRMEESLDIADELNCKGVVFHTGLVAGLNVEAYLSNWVTGMVPYLRSLAEKHKNLQIYMENTFEYGPDVFVRLMESMKDTPNVKLCLDYAHAILTCTDTKDWFEAFRPYLGHIHINDNDLKADLHLAAGDGQIDYGIFKSLMDKEPVNARVLLEVNGLGKAAASLQHMTEL